MALRFHIPNQREKNQRYDDLRRDDATRGFADGVGDVYIQNDLEVDGTIYGNIQGNIDTNLTSGSVIFAGSMFSTWETSLFIGLPELSTPNNITPPPEFEMATKCLTISIQPLLDEVSKFCLNSISLASDLEFSALLNSPFMVNNPLGNIMGKIEIHD